MLLCFTSVINIFFSNFLADQNLVIVRYGMLSSKPPKPALRVINILPVPIIVSKWNWQCSYESYLHMKVCGVRPQACHDKNRWGKLNLHFGMHEGKKVFLITEFALITWLKGQDFETELQLWGNGEIHHHKMYRWQNGMWGWCLPC